MIHGTFFVVTVTDTLHACKMQASLGNDRLPLLDSGSEQ